MASDTDPHEVGCDCGTCTCGQPGAMLAYFGVAMAVTLVATVGKLAYGVVYSLVTDTEQTRGFLGL